MKNRIIFILSVSLLLACKPQNNVLDPPEIIDTVFRYNTPFWDGNLSLPGDSCFSLTGAWDTFINIPDFYIYEYGFDTLDMLSNSLYFDPESNSVFLRDKNLGVDRLINTETGLVSTFSQMPGRFIHHENGIFYFTYENEVWSCNSTGSNKTLVLSLPIGFKVRGITDGLDTLYCYKICTGNECDGIPSYSQSNGLTLSLVCIANSIGKIIDTLENTGPCNFLPMNKEYLYQIRYVSTSDSPLILLSRPGIDSTWVTNPNYNFPGAPYLPPSLSHKVTFLPDDKLLYSGPFSGIDQYDINTGQWSKLLSGCGSLWYRVEYYNHLTDKLIVKRWIVRRFEPGSEKLVTFYSYFSMNRDGTDMQPLSYMNGPQ